MVRWVLAIDVGSRKTGVAVGQSITGAAKPLAQIRVSAASLQPDHFKKDILEWKVGCILLGLPQQADGKPHPLEKNIRRLGEALREQFHLPVEYVDEMLTSHEARQRFPRRDEIDSVAAGVMIEDFFAKSTRQ